MQRRIPFLLIAQRWLRRTRPAPPRAPTSEPAARGPFRSRKSRRKALHRRLPDRSL